MAKSPAVGAAAPDFTLPAVQLVDGAAVRSELTLSGERGHPVVLAFYPGDDTPVCTKQLCSYSSGLEQFTDLGATVWGISTQDIASHEAFAHKHGLRLPLLADTERTVAADYGITLGAMVRRSVFVVDAEGVLRWKHVAALGLTFRDVQTLTAQLALLTV
ncbi:peroxiredoxin [Streptacidiphilus pinicola]|uniref:thioredoxin-dependent peroxiredoxin n=1 Tax=Streptacidiphilus pinicola TaxID=2219663 RepID=A0A2X0K1X0_9ACTN|nr:peroxiredoxin [Streptacidiphilus pinicola]RAG81340.1 peroxiredoxin [Streptacidiphilus pinicola]